MDNSTISVAAVIRPGFAIFGSDILDLTAKAYELGANLTGEWIRSAEPCQETGGVWVKGGCEWKHFASDGSLDN